MMKHVVVVYDRDGRVDRFTFKNADLLKAKSFAYEEVAMGILRTC